MSTSFDELRLLTERDKEALNFLSSWSGSEETLRGEGNPALVKYLQTETPPKFGKAKKLHEGSSLRRLSFINDKEGKTRVIAIFDY
jgi:hypothetical protein